MASTSTSSALKSFKYDVFLSFRGEDTRNTFVSHLYKALEQRGIQTYKDDKKIEKGKTIDKQLIKSIEESRFFIIVFSKDYASSRWCLDELVKIMECQKTSEHTSDERIAYPVFYHVEPREIRNQSGAVGEAFKKHENDEAATKWRDALNEAGKLAGSELKGDESILIEEIVDVIFKKKCLDSSSVDGNLVGMETRIESILSSLELDADDVHMIGIWGMGGGGKTTLAGAVFDRISIQFDGKVFVENVREVSKSSSYGLNKLQQQILRSVLSNENIAVRSVHEGKNMMKTLLRGRKVLVVLDDVDDRKQLEALAGSPDWFKLGSRVIITTRDKQVLLSHQVKFINNVNLLSRAEAISLFNKYAFNRDIPSVGYEELSEKVVQYAYGLPLTIKVLGSLLCDQNVPQWKDTLARLKNIPLKATMEKLELSYDVLEDDHKEMFLDVACFMKGWKEKHAVIVLESCGFFAKVGLGVLKQRSLINISERGELGMHDHIEEMGKNIVRRVNPNKPEMHSRLWIKEEIVQILANGLGTQATTQCIQLIADEDEDEEGFNYEILMNGLANMKELRFLYVVSPREVSKWKFDEDSLHLPNALRFLRWWGYPFSSLPKTFQPNNLVGLEMYGSNMVKLWKDGEEKPFLKLTFLKFSCCYKLRTLDLSVAPNLETLILKYCPQLVEFHFQVTPNLKELTISECDQLEKLHMPAGSLKLLRSLDLRYLKKLRTLHLGVTPNLETLKVRNCADLVELHIPAECPKLVTLHLYNCAKLRTLDLGLTPNLESLNLKYCYNLEEINAPAECLKKLLHLKIRLCGMFRSFRFTKEFDSPEVAVTLSVLCQIAYKSSEFDKEHDTDDDIDDTDDYDDYDDIDDYDDTDDIDDTDDDIDDTDDYDDIDYTDDDIDDTDDDIGICDPGSTLRELKFSCYYKQDPALSFGNLERLISLGFGARINIDSFSDIICGLQCLRKLTLEGGIPEVPKNLDRLDCLEELSLRSTDIKTLPDSICMLKHLKTLEIKSCHLLEKLPEDIGRLVFLLRLNLTRCTLLQDIPNSICEMKCLEHLELSHLIGVEKLPEEFEHLKCLKELNIQGTWISHLPQSILGLKGLRIVGDRWFLESCGLTPKTRRTSDQDDETFCYI